MKKIIYICMALIFLSFTFIGCSGEATIENTKWKFSSGNYYCFYENGTFSYQYKTGGELHDGTYTVEDGVIYFSTKYAAIHDYTWEYEINGDKMTVEKTDYRGVRSGAMTLTRMEN